MALVQMRKKMRYLVVVVWVFLIIFVAGIFLSFQSGPSSVAGPGGPNSLFARINGQEVSNDRFAMVLNAQRDQLQQLSNAYGMPITIRDQADAPRAAYEQILQEFAQAAAAQENGIRVSRGEAEAEARRDVEQRLEQIGKGAKPEELAQYRQALMGAVDIEAKQREMLAQRLREKLTQEARPVEVKVAHILIKPEGRTDAAALKLAQTLSQQARAGADFAKLAAQHSADTSKATGGVVGWASAMPAPPPTGKDARPDPNAATSFVPEFTAAALRLRPGQVSPPVRSQFGYHVIKALEERPYEPKDEAPGAPAKPGADKKAADAKAQKRTEGIEAYKNAVGTQIAQGLFSDYKRRLEAKVEPHSQWLRGHLQEQQAGGGATLAMGPDGKPAAPTANPQALTAAVTAYEQALKSNDPAASSALAYKIAQLRQQIAEGHERAKQAAQAKDQYTQNLALLEKWARRSGDAEMFFLHGETLEKLGDKTKALEAYQGALKQSYRNPDVLRRLAEKFKTLGRKDLAAQATAKEAKQMAQQQEETTRRMMDQQRQQEMMKKMMEEQSAKEKTGPAGGAPAGGAPAGGPAENVPAAGDPATPPAGGGAANGPAPAGSGAKAPAGAGKAGNGPVAVPVTPGRPANPAAIPPKAP
ncbi:MAG TPA: peptidylprolyl isomerase [Armatimonadota bacterium]|nr:peptidylprolyl isomerase [Armatimonadota bacterium]